MDRQPWRLEWPTQRIVKQVDGKATEVIVIGGASAWNTYRKAAEEMRSLMRYWPGLRVDLVIDASLPEGATVPADPPAIRRPRLRNNMRCRRPGEIAYG